MKELLNFWKYIMNTWDQDEIDFAAETINLDTAKFQQANIAKLSYDEIDMLFGELIDLVMDGFGIDNYGDVYEMLLSAGIDENRAQEIIDG